MAKPESREKTTDLEERAVPPSLSDDWVERQLATDPLAVFGVGAAVVAFLLWAWPARCGYGPVGDGCYDFFSDLRLPFVAAFLALSFILLLLRRR
jgi:hypothetical protein